MKKLVILLVFAGCGGTQAPAVQKAARVGETHATLAGHRCTQARSCRCRDVELASDGIETKAPATGEKRFELRVSSASGQVWVTVDGQSLYKNRERAEDCFYLDLGPGEHSVAVAGEADPQEPGVGLGLRISEYRAKGEGKEGEGKPYDLAWYDSFVMRCGAPGTCSRDELIDWQKEIAANRSVLRDHCGSTKVESLRWATGRLPDGVHPKEIEMSFVLRVYPFVPKNPPRAEVCDK